MGWMSDYQCVAKSEPPRLHQIRCVAIKDNGDPHVHLRGRNALTTYSELGVAPGSFRSIHASVHHVSRRFANRPGADRGPFTLLCATFRLNWLDADHHARTQTSLIKAGRQCKRKYKKWADINGDVPSPDRGSMGGATEEMDRYRCAAVGDRWGGRVHLAFRRSSSLLC